MVRERLASSQSPSWLLGQALADLHHAPLVGGALSVSDTDIGELRAPHGTVHQML